MINGTKTMRFRVALFSSEVQPYTVTADNAQQEMACQNDRRFIDWLTDWQEAEVPK